MQLIEIIMYFSILLNIFFLIGIRNLLKQNEQLEDRVVDNIYSVKNKIQASLDNMKDIDNREVFEKDDEVGATFQQLKNIIEDLDNQL